MEQKKLHQFIQSHNLNESLLLGYYGGGNYGDELLLEVLLQLFNSYGVQHISVGFLDYVSYDTYHVRIPGYKVVLLKERINFIKEVLKTKNIIIGGGGIWGLDFNFRVFVLSLLLLISRFILRKKIYLIGVGYYQSSGFLGNIAGKMTGMAAHKILARDEETYNNFRKVTKHIELDQDIAFYIPDLRVPLKAPVDIVRSIPIDRSTVIIILRRFMGPVAEHYRSAVEKFIQINEGITILLGILEPSNIDRDNISFMERMHSIYGIDIFNFIYNPLGFMSYLKKYRTHLRIIAPQYHMQLTAFLLHIPFLPLNYDNKTRELFASIGIRDYLNIESITTQDIKGFAEKILI